MSENDNDTVPTATQPQVDYTAWTIQTLVPPAPRETRSPPFRVVVPSCGATYQKTSFAERFRELPLELLEVRCHGDLQHQSVLPRGRGGPNAWWWFLNCWGDRLATV
jgi:hypothetical protein